MFFPTKLPSLWFLGRTKLSHIVLGHHFDTKLAFNDKMFFPDEESFQRLDFKRSAADEEARRHQSSRPLE